MNLQQSNSIIFKHVEGWVGDRIWTICEFLKQDQDDHDVKGSIAEIGVHHGKLFFLIAHIGDSDTELIGIDLFEDQEKNVDKSGNGSLVTFNAHLNKHFKHLKERIKTVSTDSMSLSITDLSQIFRNKTRVFSVDGGHTVAHVINDLSIAQEVLSARGCVMLDDFMGPAWPSVSEGFFKYMAAHNKRLAPYLIFQNKLFLTTYSEHESILASLRKYLDEIVGEEMHSGRWRYSELCGFKILCFG